jgi:hypothetical protein
MSQKQPAKRRRTWMLVTLVTLVGLLVIIAAYVQATALSYSSVLGAMRERGVTIQEQGTGTSPFLRGTDHRVTINGEPVDVYEYATTVEAALDAGRISADGSTFSSGFGPIGGSAAIVEFVAPPHWFRQGRVIVLYVGRDTDVLALLKDVLGAQFAGLVP